jgi:hypothetical protein
MMKPLTAVMCPVPDYNLDPGVHRNNITATTHKNLIGRWHSPKNTPFRLWTSSETITRM